MGAPALPPASATSPPPMEFRSTSAPWTPPLGAEGGMTMALGRGRDREAVGVGFGCEEAPVVASASAAVDEPWVGSADDDAAAPSAVLVPREGGPCVGAEECE